MKKIILSILVLFVASPIYSQEQKENIFSTKNIEFLEIIAPASKVKLRKQGEDGTIKLSGVSAEDLEIVQEANKIKVRVKSIDLSKELFVFGQFSGALLKLSGKSISADLQELEVSKTDIATEKLSLVWKKNTGDLLVKTINGAIEVSDNSGAFNFTSYDSNLKLLNHTGDVSIEAHKGLLDLEKIKGKLSLNSNQSKLNLDGLEGDFYLESYQPNVNTKNVDGYQKITSKGGEFAIGVSSGERFRINSEEARIRVLMPSSSGAHINIGTEDGDLYYPKYLDLKRYPNLKVAIGRLRGRSGGSVFARSTKGSIKIEQ
ncbi:MAG: hypothetical protein VX642_08035 [Bdellovibrionota bacterium]|nr:hypothetical protein [Bdellovibrionota bacterium]